ncbi:MAG TPA: type II toxin-antitoxin system prevent-host-death family antitoxin [Longimicrobium sp.]|nr:type II toxin-antitoxin system prevent-host-death family antitoxin [Longimicrobium sp.]
MKFMSIRDIRNNSGALQRTVEEDSVTLTSNGKPFALMVSIGEEDDPVEMERIIRRARAEWAISRIRRRAQRNGLDKMTLEEIDAEIAATRAERQP